MNVPWFGKKFLEEQRLISLYKLSQTVVLPPRVAGTNNESRAVTKSVDTCLERVSGVTDSLLVYWFYAKNQFKSVFILFRVVNSATSLVRDTLFTLFSIALMLFSYNRRNNTRRSTYTRRDEALKFPACRLFSRLRPLRKFHPCFTTYCPLVWIAHTESAIESYMEEGTKLHGSCTEIRKVRGVKVFLFDAWFFSGKSNLTNYRPSQWEVRWYTKISKDRFPEKIPIFKQHIDKS